MPRQSQRSTKMIALVARRFRLLGDPFRLRLLQALEPGELTVGELSRKLNGNQPNVSKHLLMLHDAGFLSRRRDGNSIYYAISDSLVMKLCDLLCRDMVERAQQDLHKLRRPQKI